MNKKITSLFINKIDKNINNSQSYYYSKDAKNEKTKESHPSDIMVNKKINYFINLPKQLYNFDLIVKTKDDTHTTKIVGKVANSIITSNNLIIPIKDIVNIDIKK
jgi:hypothetical protein